MSKLNHFPLFLVTILCTVLNQSTMWSQESPIEKLKREYKVQIIHFNKKGIPDDIMGDLTPKGIKGDEKEITYKFFEDNRDLFKMVDPRKELKINRINKYQAGDTHIRMDQFYKGLKVFGHQLITHFNSAGKLKSITGTFLSEINVPTTPQIDSAKAVGIALSDILSKYKSAKPELFGIELIIYPFQDTIYLAWLIKIYIENPPGDWEYFLNAIDGTLIYKANRMMFHQAQPESPKKIGRGKNS